MITAISIFTGILAVGGLLVFLVIWAINGDEYND